MRFFIRTLSCGLAFTTATVASAEEGIMSEQVAEERNEMAPKETAPRQLWGWPRRRSPYALVNKGVSACKGNCPACSGDCDSDYDCAGTLKCFQRDTFRKTTVVGCVSGGWGDKMGYDYCFDPSKRIRRGNSECTADSLQSCTTPCGGSWKGSPWCWTQNGAWGYCGSSKCVGDPSLTCGFIGGRAGQWCTSHGANNWERCCHAPVPKPYIWPTVALSCPSSAGATFSDPCQKAPFYVLAHMTNSFKHVDWAIAQGANAVEVDLQLYKTVTESWYFQHNKPGGACECACEYALLYNPTKLMVTNPQHTCYKGINGSGKWDLARFNWNSYAPCQGAVNALKLLNHIATKPSLAMVYIDGKVDAVPSYKDKRVKTELGAMLAEFVVKQLFQFGGGKYGGIAVIGGYSMNDIDFLDAAAKYMQTKGKAYEDRVYFAIGQETRYDVATVVKSLSKISKYTMFGDGLTSCLLWMKAAGWYSQMRLANTEYKKGTLAMPPMIWTVDKMERIKHYIDAGVRSVITNVPANAIEAARQKGLELAKPSYRPGAAHYAYSA